MNVEEVKQQISRQGFELRAADVVADQHLYILAPPYTLEVHGVIPTLLFDVQLSFKQTGLCSVILKLDQGKTLDGKVVDPVILASWVPQELSEALIAKYGPPVKSEGICNNSVESLMTLDPHRLVGCRTTWNVVGQVITTSWMYTSDYRQVEVQVPGKRKTQHKSQLDQTFRHSITYLPPVSGL